MFSKRKGSGLGVLETIIGPDSVFQGTVRTRNSVRIDGTLEGSVAEAHGVVVGQKGRVQGDITAQVVVVGGKVTGNITASQNLEILPGAHVYGDIRSAVLTVGEGAVFEGKCIMEHESDSIIEMDLEAKQK